MIKKWSLICIFLVMGHLASSQDTRVAKGRNRLVVIYSNSLENETYTSQIEELKSDLEGLKERKLIIYKVVDNQVNHGFDPDREWHTASVFRHEYPPQNKDFEIQLIGLDGGLKLRQHTVLTKKALFETIDQMPMRRSEMNNKKN